MKADLATYEPMIWSTIQHRLQIPTRLWDEAYSEGLVLLTTAAQDYQPDTGASLSSWIYTRLFWGLVNWRTKELGQTRGAVPLDDVSEPWEEDGHSGAEWQEAVSVGENLPIRLRIALFAEVVGYNRKEIGQAMNVSDVRVGQLVKIARREIRHQLGMV